MTDESDFSRRALLASIGTVGGAGAVFGAGTSALYVDREDFGGSELRAGTLNLDVSWQNSNGDNDSGTNGSVTVDIDLSSGDSGSGTLTITNNVGSNPAIVCLRTTCPSGPAEFVHVTLSYDCNGEVVASGNLLDVANRLRNGIQLDPSCSTNSEGCLESGEDIELNLEWEFYRDNYNGNNPGNVTFDFEYLGTQCRYSSSRPACPFPDDIDPCISYKGISYIEIYADTDGDGCNEDDNDLSDPVGKLELESRDNYNQPGIGESFIEEGTYDLYEDIDDGSDTGYDVKVTDTVTKTEDGNTETIAVEFELIDPDGSDPHLCKVVIKGGSGTVTYENQFDGNATGRLLYAPKK